MAFDLNGASSSVGNSLRLRSLQHVEPCDLTHLDLNAMACILQGAALEAWQADRKDWDLNVGRNKLYFMGWQRMVVIVGSKALRQ